MDAVDLARLQFAFTIGFHILWPTFTIGIALVHHHPQRHVVAHRQDDPSRPDAVLAEDLRPRLRHEA